MKEKIKKILNWRPGVKLYVSAAVLMLFFLVIPLIRLAFYSVPWYDDYNYGFFAKLPMEKDPTLLCALKGAWECIRISWHAWQGTYGSILFMVLMPGIWGESYYCLGPIFIILLLTTAVIVFLYDLQKFCFHAESGSALGISVVGAILALEMVHTAREGFYWYNGGIHYLGMHSFMLLMISALMRCLMTKHVWRRFLTAFLGMVLAILVAGGNFVTALQGLLLLVCIIGVGILLKKKQVVLCVPALLVYVIGFYLNVTAPGNDKRADNYVGWGMPPVKSVLYSFVEGGKHVWQFTGWMTVLLLIVLLPMVFYMVQRSEYSFRFPGVITFFAFCFYATGFTPSLYSLGHAGLSRTLNAVKLTWQMLVIINVIYWCGWLCKKSEKWGKNLWPIWIYPIVGCLALTVFVTEDNQAGSFSSYGAYYYIHTGYANNFYEEYLDRVEVLQSNADSVVLKPYFWQPWMIYMGDLSTDPNDESNRALAKWYDKDVVYLQTEE